MFRFKMKQHILPLAALLCLADAFQVRPAPIIRSSLHRLYSAEAKTDINELNSEAAINDAENLVQTNGENKKSSNQTQDGVNLVQC